MNKIFTAIISILLICALIGAMGYLTDGFKDWTFDKLVKDKNIPTKEDKPVVAIDGDGNEMYEGEAYALPSAMTFLSDNNGNTQTITATVQPDTAVSDLTWTISWGEQGAFIVGNDWTNGKNVTDYVSMTVSEDTSSVSLTYIQPFGYKINVTAKSVFNENLTATCVIECRERAVAIEQLNIFNPSDTTDRYYQHSTAANKNEIVLDYGTTAYFAISIKSLGTKLGSVKKMKAYLEYDVPSYVEAYGSDNIRISDLTKPYVKNILESDYFVASQSLNDSSPIIPVVIATTILKGSSISAAPKQMFVNYIKTNPDFVISTLVIEATADGITNTFRLPIKLNLDSVSTPTNVVLDKGTITF